MPRGRLGLRAVGPKLGKRAGIVALEHVVGLIWLAGGRVLVVPVPVVRAEISLPPRLAGLTSTVSPSPGSRWLLYRMMSTASFLNSWSLAGLPSSGGGPGSIGTPSRETGRPKLFTWPQNGPMTDCTFPGTVSPFWATFCASASGCHRFGSVIVVPGSATTSGGFAGTNPTGA